MGQKPPLEDHEETVDLATRLNALQVKSFAARLRPLMSEIDRRVRDGVAQQDILAALHGDGINITLGTLRTYLKRYRQKVRLGLASPPSPALHDRTTNQDVSADTQTDDQNGKLETVLDRARRDDIGEEYLSQRPPLFKGRKKPGSPS